MTKCDFCWHSKQVRGKLVCPYGSDGCPLTKGEALEILQLIAQIGDKI